MPGLSEFLFGKGDKMKQQDLLTKEQKRGLKGFFKNPIQQSPLYGAGSNYLQNLLQGGPEAFQAFEAPYLQNFEQNIAPAIAERFAGFGTGGGASSSSALQQALAQAGMNLQTQLAGLRSGLQMQALPQALGYAQQPYQNTLGGLGVRAFENTYQPGSTGFLGQAASGLTGGLGLGAGLSMGGPMLGGLSGLFGGGGQPTNAGTYDQIFRMTGLR